MATAMDFLKNEELDTLVETIKGVKGVKELVNYVIIKEKK